MTFASRLKLEMEKRNLSQSALSDMLGVSQNAVYKWLNGGTISMENAIKLADFLDVEAAWLVFGADAEQLQAEPIDLEKLNQTIKTLPAHYQQIISDIAEALSNKYGSDEFDN